MAIIEPIGIRIAVQKIKKVNRLTSDADQNYDYEDYKYKVAAIGEFVTKKDLVGKTIVKQKNQGIELEFDGEQYIIIREEDILAIV